MTKDARAVLLIASGSLLLALVGLTVIVVAVKTRPDSPSMFPRKGWTYGGETGLFRSAETAATCAGMRGAMGAGLRAEQKQEDADSVDDLVGAARDARRAGQRVRRAASACADTIMALEPDTELKVLARDGSAYRVEIQAPRGVQPGWVTVDRVTLEDGGHR